MKNTVIYREGDMLEITERNRMLLSHRNFWHHCRFFFMSFPLTVIVSFLLCERLFSLVDDPHCFLNMAHLLIALYVCIAISWLILLYHLLKSQLSPHYFLLLPFILIGGSIFIIWNIHSLALWIFLIASLLSFGIQQCIWMLQKIGNYLIGNAQARLTVKDRVSIVSVLLFAIMVCFIIGCVGIGFLIWLI